MGKPLNDAPPACNGAAVADGYTASADPLKPGMTGFYYYGVNADRLLYLDEQQVVQRRPPGDGRGAAWRAEGGPWALGFRLWALGWLRM